MQIEWSDEEVLKLAGVGTEAEEEVIGLGPAFKVEDWYGRSGGRRHLLFMIRST